MQGGIEMIREQSNSNVSGFRLSDDKFEEVLLSGDHAGMLERYFGEQQYEELRELARQANTRSVRGGPRVLILPGIMGSKLGQRGLIFDDVLWIDPVEIVLGRLESLALDHTPTTFEAVGVILLAYLKLKLRLKSAGYDADFHPFDWRQDIAFLGRQLADRINRESASRVYLVAHSMGGLVARAAMAQNVSKIKRLIMLGTPNHGSFVPVQALRGIYPVVRKVAAVDLRHTPEELASEVFNTFPGLYQMLPWKTVFDDIDLYDSGSWPETGPRPRADLLASAPVIQQMLASADDRFVLIAGVNQETITGLKQGNSDFKYEMTPNGDGTVPLAFAQLPGAKTYYIEESHGNLPNNALVAQAVKDILSTGSTAMLSDEWTPVRRAVPRWVDSRELQVPVFEGRRGAAVRESELRHLIEEFAAPGVAGPEALPPSAAKPYGQPRSYAHEFNRLVVGRRRQQRLDIRLALGSITEVDSDAYVLGLFKDVEPAGASKALDRRLDGVISEFTARRMLSGNIGEVFLLPTGRHPVRADMILFAGLGAFDLFTDEVLQLTAENIIRTFIRTRIDDFATLILAGASGMGTTRSLENLLIGFFRGLRDADSNHRFRGITFCEMDPKRYDEMKQEIYRLSSTPLFEDIEVTLDEVTLPPAVEPEEGRGLPPGGRDPAYLVVRQEGESDSSLHFRAAVLTAGAKATVITGVKEIKKSDLDVHLRLIETDRFTFPKLSGYGERLAELILTPEVDAVLSTMKDHHLVLVHDAPSSRIPWETLRVRDWFPAMEGGLSRRYAAENLSVAKWLEKRSYGEVLDLLLVVNPTQDLEGAEEEGNRIAEIFGANPGVQVHLLRGAEATKQALLAAFTSGKYDVIHYAGHAFFDALHPSRSGIVCSGGDPLRGSELAGLGNLPGLVFFNACEAARIRKRGDTKAPEMHKRIGVSVGLAEAFLRGGVANYVGTYWPVGDAPAKTFAEIFYTRLLAGKSIGESLLEGRKAVAELKSVDWADYIHYGSQNFVLKRGESD